MSKYTTVQQRLYMRKWRKRKAAGLFTNRRLIEADSINGKKFGRLTALRRADVNSFGGYNWLCRCSCGNLTLVDRGNLVAGASTSCGCFRSESISKRRTSHGETKNEKGYTPEYCAWLAMFVRCYSTRKKHESYRRRGITVCKRWNKFENFLADMGRRPAANYSINRVDNDGPYFPKNCEWATAKQQARNKTTTHWLKFNGNKISMAEAAERYGIKYHTLKSRLRSGLSDKTALTAPIKESKTCLQRK